MCDTIAVVRPEGVWFAKNSDRDPNEAQLLDWQPRREHPAGARVRCTWLEIPQAGETHAVLLSRPFWMWGAEMGANEHGLVIGNEAVFTKVPLPREGLTGMDLLRLALERAASAREAVGVIRALLAEFPQGGGCGHEHRGFRYSSSFLVADPREAFVVETAGQDLAAAPITGARTISNGLTLPELAGHSDRTRTRVASAAKRRARTQELAERVQRPADLMRLLRDHGPDRAWPRYRRLNGALGAPCAHAGGTVAATQTTASWVAELAPGGTRHWVTGTAAPCTGLFKPVHVDEPLDLGPAPDDHDDGASLWWRHEALHRRLLPDPETLAGPVLAERDALEARWLEAPVSPEQAFKEGDAWLERWRATVRAPRDRRPGFVRRYWETRNRRAGFALALLLLLVAPPSAAAQASGDEKPPAVGAAPCVACAANVTAALGAYEPAQWKALRAGEVITAVDGRVETEDGVAARSRAAVLIEHPPAAVWSVLTDFERWPGFMPLIRGAQIVRRDGEKTWVRMAYRVFLMNMEHTTLYEADARTGQLAWSLDKSAPHDIAATDGLWQFVPLADGRQTLVRYRSAMVSGQPVPGFVQDRLAGRSLAKLLANLRGEVRRRAGD